jgi:hypothetical protein
MHVDILQDEQGLGERGRGWGAPPRGGAEPMQQENSGQHAAADRIGPFIRRAAREWDAVPGGAWPKISADEAVSRARALPAPRRSRRAPRGGGRKVVEGWGCGGEEPAGCLLRLVVGGACRMLLRVRGFKSELSIPYRMIFSV